MTHKKFFAFALLGMLSANQGNAATVLTQWGAVASISKATCATDLCDPISDLGFGTNLTVAPVNGGLQMNSATVSAGSWPAAGSAQAQAAVTGNLAVPMLKAGAISDPNSWIAGQSLAIQGYDYTGPGETLDLTWSLDGTVNNPDAESITGLVLFVGFFTADIPVIFPDISDPATAFGTLATLALASSYDNFQQYTTDGAVLDTETIKIAVNTDDQLYLAMGLMAAAGGTGAEAISLSTLTASFDGNPQLLPTLNSVPVPAAVWLFGSAVLGMVGFYRKRSTV